MAVLSVDGVIRLVTSFCERQNNVKWDSFLITSQRDCSDNNHSFGFPDIPMNNYMKRMSVIQHHIQSMCAIFTIIPLVKRDTRIN